jgi:hypothetical protein
LDVAAADRVIVANRDWAIMAIVLDALWGIRRG